MIGASFGKDGIRPMVGVEIGNEVGAAAGFETGSKVGHKIGEVLDENPHVFINKDGEVFSLNAEQQFTHNGWVYQVETIRRAKAIRRA
jgi:hypothetical protein